MNRPYFTLTLLLMAASCMVTLWMLRIVGPTLPLGIMAVVSLVYGWGIACLMNAIPIEGNLNDK